MAMPKGLKENIVILQKYFVVIIMFLIRGCQAKENKQSLDGLVVIMLNID